MITKLLIIDLKIKDIEILLKSINDYTNIILFDFDNDNFNILEEKIKALKITNLKKIGLIREEYFSTYYKLFNDQEPFILQSVRYLDPDLETWLPFILFLTNIKELYNLESFDFISCNLDKYEDYKYIFNKLETILEINIGASTDKIGNIEYGGNWNLGSVNLKEIYFTDYINNYTGTFGATFTLTIAPAVPLTYYGTNTKLNVTYGTALAPGVNSSWTRVNTISGSLTISGNVNKYFMLSNTYGFAVAKNSITVSTNGGISWIPVTSPSNLVFSDIFAWDQNNFIIWGNPNGSTSKIFKTINGGTSWLDISGNYNTSNINYMTFINDIGYIGVGQSLYRSTNYGYSWTYVAAFNGNIIKITMVSTLNIYITTNSNYFWYSLDGGCSFSGISQTITDFASVDPNIVYMANGTTIYYATLLSMSFGNPSTQASSNINSIIMPSSTVFYLFTSTNYLYSVNNRSTWNTYTYNITTSLSKFLLNDYSIYALGTDNNLYRLYISYPGTLNFYNYNTLLKTITMNKQYENTVYLSNLTLGTNNIYAYYYSTDPNYNSLSSIIIPLNVQQFPPYINTGYTISGIINHSSTIKLYTTLSSLIYETNTFFAQINTDPICQGTPYRIRMVNNLLGYSCSINGSLGVTTNGGINWSLINTGIPYISNTVNKIIDIYAWDISNILIASGPNIYRTINGGSTWITISSFVSNITAISFINENGYLAIGTFIYASFNYGLSWTYFFNASYNVTSLYMGSKNFIVWGTNNNYIGYIDNGSIGNTFGSGIIFTYVYSYDRTFSVAYNNTIVYILNNNTTSFSQILSSAYNITFVIIVNSTTIFVATSSLVYYVSTNRGTSWNTNTLLYPINHICSMNYGLYAVCQDGNLYLLNLTYPGSINIYNNNNLLVSYKTNSSTNFNYLYNLYPQSYNIYSIFVPDYSNYITLSSNVLNINVIQPTFSIYTNNSISGILNYNTTTKLYYNYNTLPNQYDLTTNFTAINNKQIINGGPYKIRMTNNNLGYVCGTGNSISRTNDGGINWTNLNFYSNYYSSVPVVSDIFGWDLSNILIATSKRLVRTIDGGITWYDISGSFNNDTSIVAFQFIDETGYLITNANIYKTINYGLSWFIPFSLGSNPASSISVLYKNTICIGYYNNYISFSYSGNTLSTPFVSGAIFQFVYMFDNNNTVAIYNNTQIYLITNKGTTFTNILTSTYYLSSVYILDLQTIIAFSNTNFYHLSYNLGLTWSLYYLHVPIISLSRINNTLYAIDINCNLQRLYLTYPGSISIIDNNGINIQTFNQNYFNFKNIGYFNNYTNSLYALITPDNNYYSTISSNIITININNSNFNLYTAYSLSGIVNYGSTIKLLYNFNIPYIIEYNTYFTQINQYKLLFGPNPKIKMINNLIGFIYYNTRNFLITINGGLNWSIININSLNNIVDLHGWDINNIIVATTGNIYKTSNGGISWNEIIGGFNSYTIYCITFINETGYLGTSNSYVYRSTDYGNTWYISFNLSAQIYFINMFSNLSIVFCTSYQFGLVIDGVNLNRFGNGSNYNMCYYYDNYTIVTIYTNNTIILYSNNGSSASTLLNSTNNDTFTCVTMVNSTTIIVSTNSNYYYISYNLGSFWYKYSLQVPLFYLYKINYKVYGIGFDSNVYLLYTINPGSLNIYNNNNLLSSYTTDTLFNFNYLSYLTAGNYNIYSLFIPDSNSNLTISSNTLNINVIQPKLISYTDYTISGIINHGSTIKLYTTFSNNLFTIDYNTHFIKFNQTSITGSPIKIYMVNSQLGFVCATGGIVSRTNDSGSTWTILSQVNSYYLTTNYQLVDIHAFDISNIIVAGGTRICRSFDGGNSWLDISGVYNTSNLYISCMEFIDETGIIGFNNNSTLYRSTNYGVTWYPYINTSRNIYALSMFSKISFTLGTNSQLVVTNDGTNINVYGNGSNYYFTYMYDPSTIVSIYNNNSIWLNLIYNGTNSQILYGIYNFTSIIMIDANTIIVTTNALWYYVSYNLGLTWSIYNILSPITHLYKKDYTVYGLGQDCNIYKLHITYPGSISVYINSTKSLTYNTDNYFNFNYLAYLKAGNYNIYSSFIPDNNSYLTLSSNTLNINVVQSNLITYTSYTISGIVNHGPTVKLHNTFSNNQFFNNNPFIIDYTTHFIKFNQTSVAQGLPIKIYMINSQLGFVCATGGIVSRTNDSGSTWTTLSQVNSYYLTTKYQLVDIHAFDISNIIVAGGTRICRSFDGGNSWLDISGVYNTSNWYISCMEFIDETGIIGFNNYSILYRSTNYGITWYPYISTARNIYALFMFSRISFSLGSNSQLVVTNDGANINYYGHGSNYYFIYMYDQNIIVSIYNYNTIWLNLIHNGTNTQILSSLYTFTSVIMINSTTIIATINALFYYVSYNLGSRWSIYNILSPITYLYKKDYAVYGLGQDGNIYKLYVNYPGSISVYNNQTNLLTYNTDSYFNFNYLSYLTAGNYNIYSSFIPDNNAYSLINSSIISFNVTQGKPTIYTNYTISGIVNHGSMTKVYYNFQNPYSVEFSTHFVKISKPTNGAPNKIYMVDSLLGFISQTGGNVSRTIDGGSTWTNLGLVNPYYLNSNYQIVDINAFDISNIIVGGGTRLYKSFDGGNNWIDISGFNTSNWIINFVKFIDETGLLGFTNNGQIYKSTNYGVTWYPFVYPYGTANNCFMYSKLVFAFPSRDAYMCSVYNGITVNNYGNGSYYNNCYIHNPNIILGIYNNFYLQLITYTNSITTLLTVNNIITGVTMVNDTTIIVTVNSYSYYISINFGITWNSYSLLSPIVYLYKTNYAIYGIGQDGYIYRLYTTYPGTISIFNNNNLLSINNTSNIYNYNVLNLFLQSNRISCLFTPANDIFLTLSSNVLNIVNNQGLTIFTISSTINNLSTTAIYYRNTIPINYDYTTFFTKINKTSITPNSTSVLKMFDNKLGYASSIDASICRTTDGGLTWSNINFPYRSIFTTNNYYVVDIYGYDLSNIILMGYTYVFITNDGGITWANTIPFTGQILSMKFIKNIGFAGVQGQLYFCRTNDFGKTWNQINTYTVNNIQVYSSKFIVCANLNGNVLYSKDGINFTANFTWINQIYIYDSLTIVFTSNQNSAVYLSLDGLNSYTTILNYPTNLPFTGVVMPNYNTIILTTATSYYYVSYNLGSTWNVYSMQVPILSIQNIGYIIYGLGYDGNLYVLQNTLGKISVISNNSNILNFYPTSYNNYKIINTPTTNNINFIQSSFVNDLTLSSNILYLTISNYYSIFNSNSLINYSNIFNINRFYNIIGQFNCNLFFNRINTVSIESSPNILNMCDNYNGFAFNSFGYLSKTTNGGISWIDISLNIQTLNNINYSGISFSDVNNFLYFGTSRTNNITRILRTNDSGTNWYDSSGIFVNNSSYIISFIKLNNNIGFAGTTNGTVLKSTDYGATWNLYFNSMGYQINNILFINTGLIFFCHNNGYFYTDGVSRTYTNYNIGYIYFMDYYDTNNLFFAGLTTVWKSVNTGVSTSTILNIPSNINITSINVISNYLLVTLNNNYYYVSIDFGNSWLYYPLENGFINMVRMNYGLYGITFDSNFYQCNVLPPETVNVYDNYNLLNTTYPINYITISGIQRLYNLNVITTNNLTNTNNTFIVNILNLPSYNNLVSTKTYTYFNLNKNQASNIETVAAYCDTTAFYYEIQTNNDFYNISFYNSTIGVASAFLPGIFITQNSGLTWSYLNSNLPNIITSVFIKSNNIIYGTTNDGKLIYSTNLGITWNIIYGVMNIYLMNIYFSSQIGVMCGYSNSIYITTDGGQTFINSYTNTSNYYYSVFVTSISGTIFAVGTNQSIIKSYDSGYSWISSSTTLASLPNNVYTFNSIYMYDENIGFVVGEKGCILKTNNGGSSWIVNKISEYDLKCVSMYNLNIIIVGGNNGVLYISYDSGNNWNEIGSGTRKTINYFSMVNNVIRFSFDGGIAKLNYNSNQIYSIVGNTEVNNLPNYGINNTMAWFDPNNIRMSNLSVIGWFSDYSMTNIGGSLKVTSMSSSEQMLSFIATNSYIGTAYPILVGGFIAVIYFKDNGYSGNDYLFNSNINGSITVRYLRTFTKSTGSNTTDFYYGISGLVAINGTTVYDYNQSPNMLTTMNNTNNYAIIYVKFSNLNANRYITPFFGYNGPYSFMGSIGDFVLLNQNHTNNDRQMLEGYLAKKWGLTSKLPINHPYYNYTYYGFGTNKLANTINLYNILSPNTYSYSNYFTSYDTNIFSSSTSISSFILIKANLFIYGQPKYYDTTSSVILFLSGVYNNNINILNYQAYYLDNNAGNNKTIFYNNLVLGGSVNNYLIYPLTNGYTVGNIFQIEANTSFTFYPKLYDGTNIITLSNYILSNIYQQDVQDIDIQSNNIIAVPRSINAGIQIVDISNIILIGPIINNYFIKPKIASITIYPNILTPLNTNIYYSGSYNSAVTFSGLINNDIYYGLTSQLPSYDLGSYTVTISSGVNENPISDTFFYYNFNIETIFGYYLQNQGIFNSYNAQIVNVTNFIDTNNFRLGNGCLTLSNSGYIKINDLLTTTNNGLTFSLWFRTNSIKNNLSIFDFGLTNYSAFKLCFDTNYYLAMVINNNTYRSSIINLNDYVWRNVVLTINNSGLTNLYLNTNNILSLSISGIFSSINGGILSTSGLIISTSGLFNPNIYNSLLIGGTNNLGFYNYEGLIDDFRVYNRVLQNYEINTLFNHPGYSFINSNNNYILSTNTIINTVLPKPINIYTSGKIYDSTNIVYYSLSGIVGSDDVGFNGIVYYNNINVGYNIISLSGILTGITQYKYFIQNYQIFGLIYQKQLFVNFNFSKNYDNNYNTSNVTYTLSGILSTDLGTIDISTNYIANYTTMYPTISGLVNVTNLSVYGLSRNNYYVQSSNSYYGIITPKPSISINQNIKLYDGNQRFVVTISGIYSSDNVLGSYYYFNDKNVGSNKILNIMSISNTITTMYYKTTITPLPSPIQFNSNNFTVTGLTGNQAYQNGTYIMTGSTVYVNYYTYWFILNGSSNTGSYFYHSDYTYNNGTYFGTYSTYINNIGNVPGEYIQIQFPYNLVITSYDIYCRPGSVQRMPATYYIVGSNDGNTWIQVEYQNIQPSNLVNSFTFNITYPIINTGYSYYRLVINRVGNDSYLNIGAWNIYGAIITSPIVINNNSNYNLLNYPLNTLIQPSIGNYLYNLITPVYGTITPININYSFIGINKIYDGTVLANVNKILSYTVPGDSIDISYNCLFTDPNVGYNKLINVNNVYLIGTDVSNYYITYNYDTTFGSIYQRQLYILFNSPTKNYDGSNNVLLTLTYTLSGIVTNDIGFLDICSNYIAYYSSVDIGTNIPIIISNVTLYGPKINNYTYSINSVTGTITNNSFALNIDSSLILYYTFESNNINGINLGNIASGSIIYDATFNNGTTTSTTIYKVGLASLQLSTQNNQFVNINKSVNMNLNSGGFTYACWFLANSTNGYQRIFDFGVNSESGSGIALYIDSTSGKLGFFIPSIVEAISTDLYVCDGVWRHVAWVLKTNGTYLIYINGLLLNTWSYAYPTFTLTSNFIGKSNLSGDLYYKGYIDDFRVYNRALEANEISSLYNYSS